MARTYQEIDPKIKKLIYQSFLNGESYNSISQLFGVNSNTCRTIVRSAKQGDGPKGEKGHRKKKLNEEQQQLLISIVEEDCQRFLEDIQEILFERSGISISRSTIYNYLERLHYSLKRISVVPERRNCESTLESRYNYALRFIEIDQICRSKLFFIDETGIAVHCRFNYGRAKIGQKANVKVKGVRGKNFSVCAAMSVEGLFFYQAQPKAYNREDFVDYIKQLVEWFELHDQNNCFIIMDNVRFHHSELVNQFISTTTHQIIFLPPYSPFLNPIEEMFNQLKFYVKRLRPKTADELFDAIRDAADVITSEDCNNYYQHMLTYIRKCVQKEEINN